MHKQSHSWGWYAKAALLLLCGAILYIQVIVVNGFNTVLIDLDGYQIELRPESQQTFGGLSWGLLRFDLDDRLDVGVSAETGANRDVTIRMEKGGHTIVTSCQADYSGKCYAVLRQDDIKMSGTFNMKIQDGLRGEKIYQGKFHRQLKPVLLIKEVILSV